MTAHDRMHFPGLIDGWARFDGPAGTLTVDRAIDAMEAYLRSPGTANVGGPFGPSVDTGTLVERARATVARLLGTDAETVIFGPNMTTLTLALTRALARQWGPGDEIVCTELDHDANVTPWVLAAEQSGARVRIARLEPATGRLPTEAIAACLTSRTKWVAVTGASNLLGTMPDLPAIVRLAHDAGARVYVDAVHLAPHRRIDFTALGCDGLVTSPYKWYGPHAGVLVLRPEVLEEVEPYKVRPAPGSGPRKYETGTPSFEAIAGVAAAASYLMETGLDETAAVERLVFGPLLEGLLSMRHVSVVGPADLVDRAPTVLFTVDGRHPGDVAAELAKRQICVWPGDSYAVEAARAMGLADRGVGVRAGVVRYVSPDDVDALLDAVARLT